jgi:phosphoribosylamine---glycine ligase
VWELTGSLVALILRFRFASDEYLAMKILVIGGGGREHALVWRLGRSAGVEKIWCAPGNGGISNDAECVAINASSLTEMVTLVERLRPDLTVIGPELPLVLGLADELRARGFAMVGPGREAARLEGSKIYAKEFLARHAIPTAKVYGVFDDFAMAKTALDRVAWPLVIKADGLCAGKGVLVTTSRSEAEEFIERALARGEFGDAGRRILLEEGLAGRELSYIVLTDGKRVIPMAPARDYKRALDGDLGPNTGGMGAYSDGSLLPDELEERIKRDVVQPTISGLAADGLDYRGFLYFGLMITPEGPKVLEYNCRLGDPETQAIVLRMDFDLPEFLMAAAQGDLGNHVAKWRDGASCYVVLVAGGYPENPQLGGEILGLERIPGTDRLVVFHSGTKRDGDNYYVSGGRVLGVGAVGASISETRKYCYDNISIMSSSGCRFRQDIGDVAESAMSAAVEAKRGCTSAGSD